MLLVFARKHALFPKVRYSKSFDTVCLSGFEIRSKPDSNPALKGSTSFFLIPKRQTIYFNVYKDLHHSLSAPTPL